MILVSHGNCYEDGIVYRAPKRLSGTNITASVFICVVGLLGWQRPRKMCCVTVVICMRVCYPYIAEKGVPCDTSAKSVLIITRFSGVCRLPCVC